MSSDIYIGMSFVGTHKELFSFSVDYAVYDGEAEAFEAMAEPDPCWDFVATCLDPCLIVTIADTITVPCSVLLQDNEDENGQMCELHICCTGNTRRYLLTMLDRLEVPHIVI